MELVGSTDSLQYLSWLYTYRFSRFDMFVPYFVNYFVRLRTNHYTLLTILPISFIFDSVRNLMRNLTVWWERRNARWFTKCHLYTYRFFHFANIFSRSRQFDDKCIAGFILLIFHNVFFLTLYCKDKLDFGTFTCIFLNFWWYYWIPWWKLVRYSEEY